MSAPNPASSWYDQTSSLVTSIPSLEADARDRGADLATYYHYLELLRCAVDMTISRHLPNGGQSMQRRRVTWMSTPVQFNKL